MSKTSAFFSILSACFLASILPTSAQEVEDYFKMSIEELMNVEVVSATKTHKKIRLRRSINYLMKLLERQEQRPLSAHPFSALQKDKGSHTMSSRQIFESHKN